MNILILRTDFNKDGILCFMADCLADALLKAGCNIEVFDYDTHNANNISDYIGRSYDAVIGFQNDIFSVYLPDQKKYLFDLIGGLKFNFWFDHPITFYENANKLPKDYYVLTLDRDYADFVNRYYDNVTKCFFFPPGGVISAEADGEQKIYDVSFLGRYWDYRSAVSDIYKFPRDIRFVAAAFLYELKIHPTKSAQNCLADVLKKRNLPYEGDQFLRWFSILRPLVLNIACYFREKIIKTIVTSGIQVHVFSESWYASALKDNPNLIIHPEVSSSDGIDIYNRSKISLNAMTSHRSGFTERCASIMLSSSMLLSESTAYLKDAFIDGQDLALFELAALDKLPDIIGTYLDDDTKRESIVKCANEKAKKSYSWDMRAKKLMEIINKINNSSAVNIYVMTHKKCYPPQDNAYKVVFVGSRGKDSPENYYLRDDDGADNISSKNHRFGELSGIYWVWKNQKLSDYVGVCHYRRFFSDAAGNILSGRDYTDILNEYDIITSKEYEASGSYLSYYNEAHNPNEQSTLREAIMKVFPEDICVYDKVMSQDKYYYGNLFATKREIFTDYCNWLFTILFECEKHLDLTGYDAYHGRVFGFLSEQLLKVYIEKKHLKVNEARIALTDEKAETIEFKQAMSQLVKLGQIDEARDMFYKVLKLRPDITLEMSDVRKEIPIIEILLYAIAEERHNNLQGLESYSNDLRKLIEHYRKVRTIFSKPLPFDKDDKLYLKDSCVTPLFADIMAVNEDVLKDKEKQIVDAVQQLYLPS